MKTSFLKPSILILFIELLYTTQLYSKDSTLINEPLKPFTNIQGSIGSLQLYENNSSYKSTFLSIAINQTILGIKPTSRHVVDFGISLGGLAFDSNPPDKENYFFIVTHFTYYIQSPKGGFETELGLIFPLINPQHVRNRIIILPGYTFIPVIKIGYRFPLPKSNIFIRLGVGYPTGFYFGLGYTM